MDKKILYIGRFFSPNILRIIKEDSNGKIGFSNHNFEMSLVKGMIKHKEIDLSIITMPSYYSYPNNSKTFYVNGETYFIDNVSVTSVAFCNLFILNKFTSTYALFQSILKYYRSNTGSNEISIIVNTPNINLLVAILLSKIFSSRKVSVTLIIPDIPTMITIFNEGFSLKKKLQGLIDKFSMYLAQKCDSFVLLTDQMKEFFKNSIRYVVVEGLIDIDKDYYCEKKPYNGKNIILYTGTLNKFFGISKLLDAFEMLNRDDAELWICGSGDCSNEIHKRSISNKNIKFFGLVDVNMSQQLQMQADILINPRGSDGEFVKYSFPSKIMEYLKTGNVVIMNKLPGIPSEYYEYVFCPKDETPESLCDTINHVLNMDIEERVSFGQRGRDFVLSQKNAYKQVEKIFKMIIDDK